MYAVYTRSKRDPYYIEDDVVGEKLKQQWLHGKLPDKVNLGKIAIESQQIKGVESNVKPQDNDDWFEKEVNSKHNQYRNYIRRMEEEYDAWHEKELEKSIEERAKNLSLPRLIWQAHTGTHKIPEDVAQTIVERQRAYLEANPNHVFASPSNYKDIVMKYTEHKVIQSPISGALMTIVHNILSKDKFTLTR